MAKISGIGTTFSIQDSGAAARDISNDVTDVSADLPIALQDTTGLDKSAHEKLALLADVKITGKGVHNNAANRLHPVFSVGPTVPRQVIITFPGGAGSVLTATCLIGDYKVSRAASGAMSNDFSLELSNGVAGAWS